MSYRYQNKWLGLVIYFLIVSCTLAKVDEQNNFLEQVSTPTQSNESGTEFLIATLLKADGQSSYTYDNVGRLLTVTKNGKTLTL